MAPPSKSSRREKYEMAKRSVVARNLQLDDSSDDGGKSDDGGNDDDDASSSSSKSLYDCGNPTLPTSASVYADFMHVINKIGSTHTCFGRNNAQENCYSSDWDLLCSCAITDDSPRTISTPIYMHVRDFRSYSEGRQLLGCCAEFYGQIGNCLSG